MALCGGLCLLMLIAIFSAPTFPLGSALLFATALQIFFNGLILSSLVTTPDSLNYRRLYQLFLGCQIVLTDAIVILGRNPTAPSNLWFGLHPGTALLVFGITLWPFMFVALWSIGFKKVVLPESHEQQIDALNSPDKNQ